MVISSLAASCCCCAENPLIPAVQFSRATSEDQHRLCLRLIASHGWQEAETYADRGISGASHLRPAYQRLLQDARHNRLDVVVAED
jgi:DNA invertase Pin-like site-specific DNA recombinase